MFCSLDLCETLTDADMSHIQLWSRWLTFNQPGAGAMKELQDTYLENTTLRFTGQTFGIMFL